LYFSCHGRSIGNKHLSLVMSNTEESNLAGSAFDVNLLGTYLSEKKINRYTLVFDCCRAGTALHVPGLRPRGLTGELNLEHLSGMGKWLIASCHDYQNANELDSLEHGLFSHYFIEGIRAGIAVPTEQEFI